MTGRTHDLAAFTALSYVVATQPLTEISLATALTAVSANFIGGLAPDIDQPTADLWNRIPAGSIVGRMLSPILGGHRFISHSFLGIFLFGFLLDWFLNRISSIYLVEMSVVWWAFMIGFVSHLMMDTFTKEGVPWFFPIPLRLGLPPLRVLRIKTGEWFEKSVVFPGLLLLCGYIYYTNYGKFLEFLKQYLK